MNATRFQVCPSVDVKYETLGGNTTNCDFACNHEELISVIRRAEPRSTVCEYTLTPVRPCHDARSPTTPCTPSVNAPALSGDDSSAGALTVYPQPASPAAAPHRA